MFVWAFVGLAISGGFTSNLAFQVQDNEPIPASETTNHSEDTSGGGEACTDVTCSIWNEEWVEDWYGVETALSVTSPLFHLQPNQANQPSFNPTLLTNASNSTTFASMNLTPEEKEKFQSITEWAIAQRLHEQPMADIIQAISHRFMGTPYKAGLLDESPEETLVVTLQAFDCVLFVETVLAIARTVAQQDYSYPTFVNHLRDQRYQNGQIDGYCSRLHYFSAWIHDNEKRGTVKNMTQALGGIPLTKPLNFMSTHRHRYPQLVNNQANYQCILEMEDQLNAVPFNYIPTEQIHHSYDQLQSGDIIGIATIIAGLDVTHTGFIDRQPDGRIRLIHASPAGEVTISQDLQQYVGKIKHAIGILVVRPIGVSQ